MAAERGATINADVEVKGLSADGFQQSYSRGRVLKTFRDNGVYVERCIVEQCDVSSSPFKEENTNRCHCTVLDNAACLPCKLFERMCTMHIGGVRLHASAEVWPTAPLITSRFQLVASCIWPAV